MLSVARRQEDMTPSEADGIDDAETPKAPAAGDGWGFSPEKAQPDSTALPGRTTPPDGAGHSSLITYPGAFGTGLRSSTNPVLLDRRTPCSTANAYKDSSAADSGCPERPC